ncbi:MAG: LacI family transcriptional regulator [Bacteroidales bacterium]|nr:LacI family transcriptional regulator [Bacteroidales bacterium]MCM1414883.1 LacI family transcriptional regulator [bacterium]MCM1424066.1 LacI family transcriptional regulator [bacterium]
MVSIKDVAKQAGVAISTVSKVLNGYPNVSEETKKKVNKAVEELNFVPNTVAAALSSKQSGRVALLLNLGNISQAVDEIHMQYLTGTIGRAVELNLDVITIFDSMLKNKSLEEIVRYLRSQSITGIIIFGMSRDDRVLHRLIDAQIFKIVTVDAPLVNASSSSVWIDQAAAQYDVAKKTLKENTGTRILYLAGKKNGYVSAERLKGMQRLAEEEGLSLLVRNGEFSELLARNLTLRYAKSREIVVCASDLMAIGAMRALMDMDIFRPVCGFDGITLMGYAGKQMNTVKQDFKRIAGAAVEEMKYLLDGGEGRQIVLDYELVRMKYEDVLI